MPFIRITFVTSAQALSNSLDAHTLGVRDLGHADYTRVWQDMRAFTEQRNEFTPDELWQIGRAHV